MKINRNCFDKDLRSTLIIMKFVPRLFYRESRIRLINKLSKKRLILKKHANIQFTEQWIARKDGSKLRICIFQSLEPKKNIPGMLWLHGGGYAIGAPDQAKKLAAKLIEASECVVVAPDYRLSIEAPYPAALTDAYETLLWMKNNAKELGIRDNQLMVGGDSAGGGLAVALSLYARDKGEVAIAFQMPLYPMLDDRMTSESAKFANTPVWNAKSNLNCWKLYLGELFGTEKVPYYAAPARAKDYSNLPPTASFVGDLEPFRDEVIQYVENLRKAGVPVDFEKYNGCYHAFEHMCPKAAVSKKAMAFAMNSFKYAAEHYFAEQDK